MKCTITRTNIEVERLHMVRAMLFPGQNWRETALESMIGAEKMKAERIMKTILMLLHFDIMR